MCMYTVYCIAYLPFNRPHLVIFFHILISKCYSISNVSWNSMIYLIKTTKKCFIFLSYTTVYWTFIGWITDKHVQILIIFYLFHLFGLQCFLRIWNCFQISTVNQNQNQFFCFPFAFVSFSSCVSGFAYN